MAGRIRDDDIAEVREKARIDEVVSSYVTLRNAGGGSMKGLCPFHDEKSPSFNVNPARAFFHCFGCQEGGDVFSFLMKIDGITFSEAVERLADKYGVQLRREDGGAPTPPRGPQRSRLIDAHKQAQLFYAEQLATPDAVVARQFLDGRGFDQDAAATFGVGFAPNGGEVLFKHLRQKGFSEEELVTGGLVGRGRGLYDRFRGRLLWPIRDASGDVIGFGARRIFDDDRIEAKYLNTSDSPIYKKSQVLYGIDLARREIGRTSQAVVVEGYTDVMACHLAGVGTAVATCGTSFGDDHARVLRRFLHDHDEFRGEVIFTFDGDSAGQKAALRAFGGDQNFVSQTYVAIEPDGLDPCDLRIKKGDEAVRDLVSGRVPLYRFVLGNVLSRYDLDRADGRIDALREAAVLVSSVRDKSKIDAFAREIASSIGVDVDEARTEVRRAAARQGRVQKQAPGGAMGRASGAPQRTAAPVNDPSKPQQPAAPPLPNLRDPRFAIERETLKLVLHHPEVVVRSARDVTPADFTHPTYRGVWEAIQAGGGPESAKDGWAAGLRDHVKEPAVAAALTELSVEPLLSKKEPDLAYVHAHVYRLRELTVLRSIADVKSKLQRTNPDDAENHNALFGELMTLEAQRRTLRDAGMGT
ncbi:MULTISPECIES: DNA primase [unclassified Nocardioides]|uniref:DNA primase n=1 Tax=unclassified Nocardioides TaxID=2615069 RepID=UPI0006F860B3|nr:MULTISPECIES: DNA primase [unclassified Nocardioides]KQY61797.1 DNA primase [Nocardioides sp. Root140]KQZ70800.1 DNA primase [Nocardioides sp. Root151]KRF10871.1 DNA primase [Nocardioides sp. Soil796]